jgi:hypothetical protein
LNAEQQLKILAMIWDKPVGDDVGYVFLPWIPGWAKDKAERRANWNEGRGFKWPHEKDAILAHLKNHTKDDLYFTPNTFLGESRIAQYTGEETALYADLDGVDPTEDIDRALQPTIAWETSPGRFQGIWLLDDFADGCTEAGGLNHRLTAALGADPSGWDTTQLLRVPGRLNFKFNYKNEDDDSSPPGRLLWVRDKRFSPKWLHERLPEVQVYGTGADVEDHEIDAVNRREVWYRVRMKVSSLVRDEYMTKKSREITENYDRSEVLWQIERDLADAGCSIAEIVAIVRETPWNKHAGRNNELAQLKAEAAKAIAVKEQDNGEQPLESTDVRSGIRPVEPTWAGQLIAEGVPRPKWLIRKIWGRGFCGFIAAEPKSYKSYFAMDLAISIATGKPFLNDRQFGCTPAPVLYLQEEDGIPLTVLRYEQVMDGKHPEGHPLGQMTMSGNQLIWNPPMFVPVALEIRRGFVASDPVWQSWLLDFIQEHGFAMTIIDTLGTSIGDIDINDAPKLYPRVLNPLKQISNTTGCSIAIVHHNRKAREGHRAGQQMAGSQAFHAWTESALYLSKDEPVTGQPAVVKVEREDKLDGDLKFRVRIPHIGYSSDEEIEPWNPEVWPGWAETDAAEQEAKVEEISPAAGDKIAGRVQEAGGRNRWVTLDQIRATGTRSPEHALLRQLKDATANGYVEFDGEDCWRFIKRWKA